MTDPTPEMPADQTTAEELARFDRQRWADAAKANVELEGFFASPDFEDVQARYVAGELSLGEMLKWLDDRHPDQPAA